MQKSRDSVTSSAHHKKKSKGTEIREEWRYVLVSICWEEC